MVVEDNVDYQCYCNGNRRCSRHGINRLFGTTEIALRTIEKSTVPELLDILFLDLRVS